jgi:uncharacterized protein
MLSFEWDPRKSEANRRKHGLTFEDATRVFHDPLKRLDIEGDEHGEIRWRTTGTIDGILYVVSHTIREEGEDDTYRIITARRATPRESKIYEETP